MIGGFCTSNLVSRSIRFLSSYSMHIVLLLTFLSVCVSGSKRKFDTFDESQNEISYGDGETSKRMLIASDKAQALVEIAKDKTAFDDFFGPCPIENAADFAFLYEKDMFTDSKRYLAFAFLKSLKPTDVDEVINELSQYNNKANFAADLLTAAREYGNKKLFRFCVPIVNDDPSMKVEAFRGIFEARTIFGGELSDDFPWFEEWVSIIYGRNEPVPEHFMTIPKSSELAVAFLLELCEEREIDYFLSNFSRRPLHGILNNIVTMILEKYTVNTQDNIIHNEDNVNISENTIITKMAFIEMVKGLDEETIASMQVEEETVAQYKNQSEEFKASLILNNEVCRRVMKIAVTAHRFEAPFPTTVSAIGKMSDELLHYGAIELFQHFEVDMDEDFPYDLTNIDPSYDNYRIFEIVIQRSQWNHYGSNVFVEDEWCTSDCLENICRILINRLPQISANFQDGDRRLHVGVFSPDETEIGDQFSLYGENFLSTNSLDDQVETVLSICRFLKNHEMEDENIMNLIRAVAIHFPDILPYLYSVFNDYIKKYLEVHAFAFEYMKAVCQSKCLEGAILAAKVSKPQVAYYLLRIYDEILDSKMEFDVELLEYNGKLIKTMVPFYGTILLHLYDGTEYQRDKILHVEDPRWMEGIQRLNRIASGIFNRNQTADEERNQDQNNIADVKDGQDDKEWRKSKQ